MADMDDSYWDDGLPEVEVTQTTSGELAYWDDGAPEVLGAGATSGPVFGSSSDLPFNALLISP